MAVLRALIWLLLTPLLAALAFSFAGALHPAGDTLALFRPALIGAAGLLCLILLALGGRRAVAVPGVALGAAVVPALAGFLPLWPAAGGEVTLYQKNLFSTRHQSAALVADILAAEPDFVTLQEIVAGGAGVLQALEPEMPGQLVCSSLRRRVGIATRHPVVEGSAICDEGLAALQVEMPQGRAWVVSVHLHWPWPHRQPGQVARLTALLAGLEGPVFIGGDFNMAPVSATLRRFADAAKVRQARPLRGTYSLLGVMPIAIDQVLAPGGGVAELRDRLGSDHRGVLARVAF